MVVSDAEIARMAGEMIEKYGAQAPRLATERLNEMIDRGNKTGRDIWACVVHEIHDRLGAGPKRPTSVPDWRSSPARLDCAPFAAAAYAMSLL